MKMKKSYKHTLSEINSWNIDKSWTLFLDRDGTINTRLVGDYVTDYKDFNFIPKALDAFPVFNTFFDKVIIVTNQQGVGKGIMEEKELRNIHVQMLDEISFHGGFIDEIYYCPFLASDNPECRKPDIGMGLQASADFPDINFSRSIMIGDSKSDIEFGRNLGMKTIFIDNPYNKVDQEWVSMVDIIVDSLYDFSEMLVNHLNFKF